VFLIASGGPILDYGGEARRFRRGKPTRLRFTDTIIDDEAEVGIPGALRGPRAGVQPSDQQSATTDIGSENNHHGADGGDWMISGDVSGSHGRDNGQRWKNENGDPQ
jgi:hypothetical protein